MIYDRKKQSVYKGQHPLKLYEYLASGLPVVSTPHDEFSTLNPPIKVVTKESEITDSIRELLTSHQPNQSKVFAKKYSWDQCWKRATEILTNS